MRHDVFMVRGLVLATILTAGCKLDSKLFNDRQSAKSDETKVEAMDLASDVSNKDLLPSDPLKITGIASSGDGCKQSTISTDISEDGQAFTVLFAEFFLNVESEGKPAKSIRKCNLELSVDIPQGWQMAVIKLDHRGFASLPKGSSAKLSTEVFFSDKAGGKKAVEKVHGPFETDFLVSNSVDVKSLKWSKCGGQAGINIDIVAKVQARRNVTASMTVDTLDGELSEHVAVKWQKCK